MKHTAQEFELTRTDGAGIEARVARLAGEQVAVIPAHGARASEILSNVAVLVGVCVVFNDYAFAREVVSTVGCDRSRLDFNNSGDAKMLFSLVPLCLENAAHGLHTRTGALHG